MSSSARTMVANEMGRRIALLVATYEYEDAGLRQLTAPARDAEALATVLSDEHIAGFEVKTLINEPHYRVGEAISELYRDRHRDDLTVLYFTCHGLKDDDGRLYLATANTRRESLLFTSLPAEQIDQAMSACASHQRVLVLDCCYGGAFPASGAKGDAEVHALDRFRGRGRVVLTASDATQYAFEGNRAHGQPEQSVFTRHLVQGLHDGDADLDGDGDITIDELYTYVHDRVIDETPRQRPKRQDNVEGRIIIARNVNWVLPQYLRHALASPIPAERMAALDGLTHLFQIGNQQVRARALAEIRRLTDDDSRAVSAAADERLRTLVPQQPSPEPPGSAPPQPETEPSEPQSAETGPSEAVADDSPAKRRFPWQARRARYLLMMSAIVAVVLIPILIVLLPRHPPEVRHPSKVRHPPKVGIGITVHDKKNSPSGPCIIASVLNGTPASRAGLRRNDVIISLDNTRIATCHSLATKLKGYSIGDVVSIEVNREKAGQLAFPVRLINISGLPSPSPSPSG